MRIHQDLDGSRIASALPLDTAWTTEDNPFATPEASRDAFAGAAEGSYEYRLVAAQPSAGADVESDADEIAVEIRWGRTLLYSGQLAHGRGFVIGEPDDSRHVDFVAPCGQIGATHVALVLPGGRVALSDPGARLSLAGTELSVQDAVAAKLALPSSEAGVPCVALTGDSAVTMTIGELTVILRGTKGGKKVVAPLSLSRLGGGAMPHILASFAAVVSLLGAVSTMSPPLNATDGDQLTEAQLYYMRTKLNASAERETAESRSEHAPDDANVNSDAGGRSGQAAKGSAGAVGSETAKSRDGRWAVAKSMQHEDPQMARQAMLVEAATWGTIGLLNSGDGGGTNEPISPWGGDLSNGFDASSANGTMWANDIHDAAGAGGLTISGIGEGGDGPGRFIGVGPIGTIGGGNGVNPDHGLAGGGHGRITRGHKARPPSIRTPSTTVSGRIPPAVIQRIVRQNYGRFRACYEAGLRTNPSLAGRVSVRFVIGRDGRVSNVSGGGDLPDSAVISCITRSFYSLTFSQPDKGIVTVGYSLAMTPGG